mmetsp:Transcript_22094/g.32643  ORF Transcript_22094/g.32643 Transcript_22094/m.32643 type:complete len:239 (-) Transcript_22094:89-805(-)
MEDDSAREYNTLQNLFQSCSSIIKTAQSLKTIQPNRFDDIDAVLDQERDIARWLDQQILVYQAPSKEFSATDPSCSTVQSKKDVQHELLQNTWDQNYQTHLLADRMQMSKSAAEAIKSNTKSSLIQEALKSRNALVDDVVRLQAELLTTQTKLNQITKECREVQSDTRKLWAQEKQSVLYKQKSNIPKETKNWILRQILMDLIVGEGNLDLYQDKRLAQIFLQLEERSYFEDKGFDIL